MREVGCAIIGQTDDLAPADRRLYAIRDVTGTVESIPLIAASILSKKLAAGLDGLVMDVKTGGGAFIADPAMSRALAGSIVDDRDGAGVRTTALITDMDAVLGHDRRQCARGRRGGRISRRPARAIRGCTRWCSSLAAEMLLLGNLAATPAEARAKAQARLDDGSAAEIFARMVAALDGPSDFLERHDSYLPCAGVIRPCVAEDSGFIVGDGNPRDRHHGDQSRRRAPARERPDRSGGRLERGARRSARTITAGEPLAMVHAASEADAEAAIAALQAHDPHCGCAAGRATRRACPHRRAGHREGRMSRAFILVLDSVGIGAAPDADATAMPAPTRSAISRRPAAQDAATAPACAPGRCACRTWRGSGSARAAGSASAELAAPAHRRRVWQRRGSRAPARTRRAAIGRSPGCRSSSTGAYFPRTRPCFPPALIAALVARCALPGILGDCHASGTDIIRDLGEEHVRTGKPICYTSADSVFQIAAHETHFGLERLYAVCAVAKELTEPLNIGRVIARPFVGESAATFRRTTNRKDLTTPPHADTLLDRVTAAGGTVVSIGKIADIFAHRGISRAVPGEGPTWRCSTRRSRKRSMPPTARSSLPTSSTSTRSMATAATCPAMRPRSKRSMPACRNCAPRCAPAILC